MIHFLPQTPSSLPLSILLLISISVFIIPSHGQLLGYTCPTATNDTTNLDFNVNSLLSSLSSKASTTNFYNQTSNGIHGLFLCRGDVSNEECSTCITNATQQLELDCPSRTEAIIWFEKCMLRYSNQNFIGTLQMSRWLTRYSLDITSPSETSDIVAWARQLILDASREELMFKAVVRDSGNLRYGLAQCTRDINSNDCHFCLTSLVNMSLDQQVVSQVCAPNCYLRIETFPFFNGTQQALPPSS